MKVVDIGLATSAAPMFFPASRVGECLYADGGLFANSPDLIALHEASYFLGYSLRDAWMLSIGTTTNKYSIADSTENSWGLKFWAADAERRLPNVAIAAQQQFAEQIVGHSLGNRYIRLDTNPSHEQAPFLALDRADDVARKTLTGLGTKAGTDARGDQRIRGLWSHVKRDLLLAKEG